MLENLKWDHLKRVTPWRLSSLYALIGGLWIVFSDRVLGFFVVDHDIYIQLSTVKGWLYVVVTSVLLYFLFYWGVKSQQESEVALQESYIQLQLKHTELQTAHEEMEATHEELVAAEEELKQQFYEVQEQEAYYRRIYEGISSGILVQDRFGKLIHANDAASRLLKRSRLQLSGPTLFDGTWEAKFSEGTPFRWEELPGDVLSGNTRSSMYRVIEVSGETIPKSWLSIHSDPIQNVNAEHDQEIVTTLVDITEEKTLETYEHLLKEIDRLVLQEKPLAEIEKYLCEQLVKEMDLPWVWIGMKKDDGMVEFRAQAGIKNVDSLIVRWDESPYGQGAVGRTIQTGGKHVDVLEGNPLFEAWKEFAEQNGLRSVAAFPLTHQGETFGALTLYSREADFFDVKRIAFLERFSLQLALTFNSAQDREHLERYRLLAEDSLEIILFIHPDGRIIDANEAAVNRYGYTREELTHLHIQDLRLLEDKSALFNQLQKARLGIQFESLHRCKDGSVFPVDVSSKGTIFHGNPIIVSIIRETTERKNAEAMVWLAKERAQVTLDSIGDAVITTDVLGIVEYLNPIAEALTGWTTSEAVGHPLEQVFRIVNEKTGKSVESPIVRCLREGRIVGLANHTVLIHREGQRIAIEDSAAPIRDRQEAVIGGVLVFHDVSDKRNLMRELAHQAHHDALTSLPNRLLFNELLNQALAQARRKRSRLAVLFLDLDRFKLINDTMGHNMGDRLLKESSERLKQALREGDTIARQGGDEFLVLLPEIGQEEEAASITERILAVFLKPFVLDWNEVFISTSVGISLYPNDGSDLETLVKQADTAMYYAKEQGRNNYQFFTPELNSRAHERLSLENSLRRALEREEFVLYYQPQVDFESGCIVGVEALIRWNSVERGIVSPDAFISIAEETGLIVPIGEWVLRRACTQNLAWQEQGYPPWRIAVNISARQLQEPHFIELVARILQETEMDPQWLEIEITESIAMEKGESSVEMLRSIKELGVRISIDDFGTGFSSLNYLRQLPVDTLKIDQSFVRDICPDANGEAVITAIILLAQNLRLKVIAEGVETETQWSFLKDKRCDEMQGYFFSKPLPAEDLEKRFLHPQG
ncbi:bifunctional diguanylate cyclase/phosphodiesterase [Desulfosporosinus metallidurans]|uniref:Diguanylate cyclase/phosphodiesterase (GGDEF & EAL domains) with PAS/PAC sensor(S) n=1 Tax=Desulfosporosinus metallidurans TaxID=1888891 RepID=A0A1Q8QW14_9FIRM|nr:EAL domain-containing protein [Desulfosporosinus metallidurans]OLN31502.1 diguanylate cyclase/phosphodiesterase (GGDEF & EAL domains) with PAS/PAC sensor(s) [Desulfosporosinus metallidurans]